MRALTDAILFSFLFFSFFFFFWGGGGGGVAVYKHMAIYDGYCPEMAVRFAFILTERATCYFGYRMVFALFCMDSSLIILRNMLKMRRKHQSSAPLAFAKGVHRRPVDSPQKGPVVRKRFPFDDVIMISPLNITVTPLRIPERGIV